MTGRIAMSSRKAHVVAKPSGTSWTHHVSDKLEVRIRAEKGGYGVFATETIHAGELLVMWGGVIVPGDKLDDLSPVARRHSIQVEDNLFLAPHELPEPGDYVNHSCDPNAGLNGQSALVAMRLVMPGEEVCYDYAMSDGSPYDEFECSCNCMECRGRVTGNDWMIEDLQFRYSGFFSPYLQRRVDAMQQREQREQRGRGRSLRSKTRRLIEIPS